MTHSTYPILDLTFIAAEDLSSYQYYLVEMGSTEGTVQRHTTDDVYPIGILRNKPTSGQTAVVRLLGVTEAAVKTGGVAYGALVGVDVGDSPTGLIGAAGANEAVFGKVLNASGTTAGQYATILCDFIVPTVYAALA